MKKVAMTLLLATMMMLLYAGVASAHVTVQPAEAPAGSRQIFTVRVPSEEEAATTTQVKVAIPDGADVTRLDPKADWTYELEKNGDGKITAITWTAKGDGLAATEFTEFRMSGKVAEDAAELSWKAYQTYSDGTVVEWTGASGSDHPASVTTVTAATGSGGDGHGAAASAGDTSDEGASSVELTALILSIVGLAAGLLALVIALLNRRKV